VPHAKFGAFVRHVTKISLSHPTKSNRKRGVWCLKHNSFTVWILGGRWSQIYNPS